MKIVILLAIASSCIVLATSSTAQGLENWSLKSNNNNNFCQGCRSIVSYITRFNSSSSRGDSKKLLQNYCETIYPVSTDYQQGPCPIFVEGFFWFMDRVDPVSHCDQIGACGPEDTATPLVDTESDNKIPIRENGIICDTCEQFIIQLQGLIENPAYVDMIKKQIANLCEYLSIVNESKECMDMLNSYADEAIEFVRKLQPLKYCQSIQLCSATYKPKSPVVSFQKKPTPSLASFKGFGIETKVVVGDQVVKDIAAIPERQEGKHNPTCMFCKAFVKEIFKFLGNNRTEESIRDGLDKICAVAYRDPQKRSHCDSLVATYSKEFVQLLIDETDPELICTLIEQCSYQTGPAVGSSKQLVEAKLPEQEDKEPMEQVDLNMLISMLDPTVQPSSLATCVECKIFIQYLRNSIENPKSVEEIHQWLLTNLCDTLQEKKMKDSCYNMVNNYASIFFKAIATDLDPKKACIELKACNQRVRQQLNIMNRSPILQLKAMKPQAPPPATAAPQLKSQLCDQCVQIVSQIDDYLSSHPIDHDVSTLVDEVCNKLPVESAKNECTVMIKIFGQDIAQAIATMDNPKQLCSKIMLC